MEDICNHPPTEALARTMMGEALEIAEALGVRMRHTIDKRIEGARAVGPHKTSTLQDVEQGRPMELAPILGAVIELGARVEVPTPTLSAVYACASGLNATLTAAMQKSSCVPG